MTNAILRGKPDAGNPHVRFDEGEVTSAKPRPLLYTKKLLMALVLMPIMAFAKDYVLDHDGMTCDDFGTVSFPAYFKGSLTSAEGAVPFNGYAPFQFVAPATGVYYMSLEITRNNGTQIQASASLRDTLGS